MAEPGWLPMTCQCEHDSHERGCDGDTAFKVKTDWGTYYLCVSCKRQGHLAPYSKVEVL